MANLIDSNMVLWIRGKVKLILLGIIPIFIALGSCTPYKVLEIQTLKPAEFALPKETINPVIVAGLYRGIEGVEESMAQAALDSVSSLEAVLTLAESLSLTPLFEDQDIPVIINYRTDTSREIVPYEWDVVDSIAQSNQADLVISLEYLKITPHTDSYSYWDGSLTAYYGFLTCRSYAYWRAYDVVSRKITAMYLHRDTVTWEQYDYTPVKIGQQLPGLFSAASYCGYETGLQYGSKIAPTWMDEQRVYFAKGSKPLKGAAKLVENGQWLDAATQWQSIIQSNPKKVKLNARAAFNMALANEMMGNFEMAEEWLTMAEEYYPLSEIDWYRRIIRYRIQIMEKF